MTTEQKKVSLTIETDWATYQYVDTLSKTIEQLANNMNHIEIAMKERLAAIQEMAMTDPTEWLEDVEEEIRELRKSINTQHNMIANLLNQPQKQVIGSAVQKITAVKPVEIDTPSVEEQIKSALSEFISTQFSDMSNCLEEMKQTLIKLQEEKKSVEEIVSNANEQVDEGYEDDDNVSQQVIQVTNDESISSIFNQIHALEENLKKKFEYTLNSTLASQMGGVTNRLDSLMESFNDLNERQKTLEQNQEDIKKHLQTMQNYQSDALKEGFEQIQSSLIAEFSKLNNAVAKDERDDAKDYKEGKKDDK